MICAIPLPNFFAPAFVWAKAAGWLVINCVLAVGATGWLVINCVLAVGTTGAML